MKLTAILLLAAALQVSANGFGQGITLTLKEASLEKTIAEIEKQSGYSFVYGKEQLAQAKTIDLTVRNEKLESVLDLIFKDQPLTYTISGKYIAIRQKTATSNSKAEAPPPIDVHGRVVNDKGEPVAGANVFVKGTTISTSTDANGYFTLKGVDEKATLTISAVNIEELSLKVNGKTELATLSVKTKVTTGENVVVNTGYQVLKPNEITGSVVVITKEQLDQRIASNIIDKLEGITNGLVFNKNATTGENELRIRGESTIFGYTEPLIVLDNFPYDGDINDINPNDVENITILKDAAAASIYGVRAGNGVIIITTKRGKANQTLKLSLNVNTRFGEKPDLFYPPLMNSSDFIDVETFLFSKGKYISDLGNANLPAVSPVVDILDARARGLISPSDSVNQINMLRANDWRRDYLKYIYRNAVTQQYQLNLSGGSTRMNYYFSAGYDKSLSGIIGDESNRITLNNQTSYRPFKNLQLNFGLGYTENTSVNNGVTDINIYPYTRLVDDNGNQLNIPKHRAKWEDTIANHNFLDWKYYPLQERNHQDNRNKVYTTRLSTSLNYIIVKGLSAQLSYQYLRSSIRNRRLKTKESYDIRNNMNRFAIQPLANGNYAGTNYPNGGELDLQNSDLVSHNGRFQFNYARAWNHHSIIALAGFEAKEVRTASNSSRFIGYDEETGSFVTPNTFVSYPTYPTGSASLGDGGAYGLSYSGTLTRFRSYFANAAYTYKHRYIFSASARFDGSNLFGVKTNDKITPLWSAGAKWNISNEKFYKMKQLPELYLGVTYGYNGNVSPSMVAVTTINYQGNAINTGLPYAVIQNNPNPQLRWEKSGQLNIALTFVTKNNVVTGSLEYFRKNGKDLYGSKPIDPTTGITQLVGNFSDMKSKGFDLGLTVKNIDKKVKWTTSLVFNYATEKVTRYDVNYPATAYKSGYIGSSFPIVGYPVRYIFSYRWGGLDATTGNPMIILGDTLNKTYGNSTTQNIKISDLVFGGRYNPPYYGSIRNTISWKGLELTFNITYKLGHYFRRSTINYLNFVNNGWQQGHKDFILRWQKPGDEQHTNVPSFIYPIPITVDEAVRNSFYTDADILIEKADHFKLQFINLSYDLSKALPRKLKIESFSLFVNADNLNIFLWRANKHGIDPDYPYLQYTPSRTYTIGLRANF